MKKYTLNNKIKYTLNNFQTVMAILTILHLIFIGAFCSFFAGKIFLYLILPSYLAGIMLILLPPLIKKSVNYNLRIFFRIVRILFMLAFIYFAYTCTIIEFDSELLTAFLCSMFFLISLVYAVYDLANYAKKNKNTTDREQKPNNKNNYYYY